MPDAEKKTVKCPECGEEMGIIVYDAVNVEQNPDMRSKVVAGEIFRQECPNCKKVPVIQYPTLYHDAENKFMVWFMQDEDVSVQEYIQKKEMRQEGYRMRIVNEENDLREKILIFENKLDDRLIEICKLMALQSAIEKYPDIKPGAAYFMRDEDGKDSFVIVTATGETITAELNPEAYEEAKKLFEAGLEEEGSFVLVNLGWAMEFLDSMSEK